MRECGPGTDVFTPKDNMLIGHKSNRRFQELRLLPSFHTVDLTNGILMGTLGWKESRILLHTTDFFSEDKMKRHQEKK